VRYSKRRRHRKKSDNKDLPGLPQPEEILDENGKVVKNIEDS